MKSVQYGHRYSTRVAYLCTGTAVSVWGALVPFVQLGLNLEPARLGLLLLCLGIGALLAMPITGSLASRFGCRPVVLVSGAITCAVMPVLSLSPSAAIQAAILILFGAAVGALDVATSIQAVIVESTQGKALMSGFHAQYSIGGFVGAGGMTLLMWAGASPLTASCVMAAVTAIMLYSAAPYLLSAAETSVKKSALFAIPHGSVISIGILCFIVFLAEGAMLDWGGILLTTTDGYAPDRSGIGYAIYALAMTIGRLGGDPVVRYLGRQWMLLLGGVATAAGFFIIVLTHLPHVALAGFLLIGAGASNIVPILFSAAGRQKDMPAGIAISVVSTIGYLGVMAGPALIGITAHALNLHLAFAGLGVAMLVVAASAGSGFIKHSSG